MKAGLGNSPGGHRFVSCSAKQRLLEEGPGTRQQEMVHHLAALFASKCSREEWLCVKGINEYGAPLTPGPACLLSFPWWPLEHILPTVLMFPFKAIFLPRLPDLLLELYGDQKS